MEHPSFFHKLPLDVIGMISLYLVPLLGLFYPKSLTEEERRARAVESVFYTKEMYDSDHLQLEKQLRSVQIMTAIVTQKKDIPVFYLLQRELGPCLLLHVQPDYAYLAERIMMAQMNKINIYVVLLLFGFAQKYSQLISQVEQADPITAQQIKYQVTRFSSHWDSSPEVIDYLSQRGWITQPKNPYPVTQRFVYATSPYLLPEVVLKSRHHNHFLPHYLKNWPSISPVDFFNFLLNGNAIFQPNLIESFYQKINWSDPDLPPLDFLSNWGKLVSLLTAKFDQLMIDYLSRMLPRLTRPNLGRLIHRHLTHHSFTQLMSQGWFVPYAALLQTNQTDRPSILIPLYHLFLSSNYQPGTFYAHLTELVNHVHGSTILEAIQPLVQAHARSGKLRSTRWIRQHLPSYLG